MIFLLDKMDEYFRSRLSRTLQLPSLQLCFSVAGSAHHASDLGGSKVG